MVVESPMSPIHTFAMNKRLHPSENEIHEVTAKKPFEIMLTNISAIKNKLPKRMGISHATSSPVIRTAVWSLWPLKHVHP